MRTIIKLSDITLPNESYKYNPEDFLRLKESIKNHGLFHFPIIYGNEPPYKIVAGRARVLALQDLGYESITVTILEESYNSHEISLHENLRRNNLSWYEAVVLEKELHELRISQYGDKKSGRPKTGEIQGWSQADTARELGIALGAFSQDMALATELKRNHNLKNVKDKSTALKLIRRIVKQQAAEIEQALESSIKMDDIFLGDSIDILKQFPSDLFDCCITDPPWSEYKDETLKSDQIKLLPIFLDLHRVLRRDSFLYIVTSTVDYPFYLKELPKIGFRVQSYPIIWHKAHTITHGRTAWQYARDYEPIIVAVKGNPVLTTTIELSSILKYDNLHYTQMIHPHEKPIDLIKAILRVSTNPGAKVIDVFAGSGVVLEACKKTDRRYIGIEKEKKFYDQIVKRLQK